MRAPDRIGLLHRITRTLFEADLDVVSARVSTLGEIVVDAFYVRESDGDEGDRRGATFEDRRGNWSRIGTLGPLSAKYNSAAMAGEHVRNRKGPRWWVVLTVGVAVLVLGAAGVVVANLHFNQAAATPAAPPPALTVVSVSPTGTNVAAGSTISVQFSTDLAPRQLRCRP